MDLKFTMKLFHVIFHTVCHVFAPSPFDKRPPLPQLSMEKFKFDFTPLPAPPSEGKMLVWKISENEKGLVTPFYGSSYNLVESNKVYLIAMRKYRDSHLHIYYWLGLSSSLADKKKAAKYAVELFFFLQNFGPTYKAYVSREFEGSESLSFQQHFYADNRIEVAFKKRKHIKKPNKADTPFDLNLYLDTQFPLSYQNLYLVKGVRHEVRMKKVTLAKQWVNNYHCLVMETIDENDEKFPSALYCGHNVDPFVHKKAERLAKHINSHYFPYVGFNVIHSALNFQKSLSNDPNTSFVHELDAPADALNTPYKFIESHDKSIKLYKVATNSSWRTLKDNPMPVWKITLDTIPTGKGPYIVQTRSIAGIFIYIDTQRQKEEEALNTVQIVEDMLLDLYPHNPVPVRIMHNYCKNTDYLLTFVDFLEH